MGNVTLPVGATDKRVTEYLRAYFESERERYGAKSYVNQYAPQPAGMWTQDRLARAIGHNNAWLSRRMSGLVGWTQTDLDKIARALGVPLSELQAGAQEEVA